MGMGDDYYLILFTLSLLFGIAFAFIFVLHHILVGSEPNGIPEGRAGWPIIGETIGFLRPHRSNSMGKFLQDHCAMHGKVYLSHLFGTQTIVSCDYELNSFILRNEERLFECNYPKPIHEILGKLSLLAFGGDMHKKLRVALGLINSWRSNVCHLHDINKQVISILKSWEHKERIIFCNEARKFTFSVILKQTLSMGPEEPLSTRILLDFLTFMKGLVSFPLYIPGTSYAKAVKARARISSTVLAIVQERKKRGVKNRKCDFLDVLLSNGSLNDGEKVSLVLDILHGGYETTSTLLAMALYFLGRSPLALMQLKEEHLSTRRRKKEEHLDWEDYKQMLFTQNVIQEALRCGNIVKFVHRRAREDVRFKGYLIPSGWKVLPVFSAVHLDPSLHENASEYFPWRWEVVIAAPRIENPFPLSVQLQMEY